MAGLVALSVLLVLAVSSYGRRLNAQLGAAQVDGMDYFVRVQDGKFVVGPSCKPYYISGKLTLKKEIFESLKQSSFDSTKLQNR